MAIKLSRPISRELFSTDRKGRPLIIELVGGDVINFRIKGSPKRFSLFLGHAFRLAQIFQADEDYKARMQAYTEKKKAGYKHLKKPKRYSLPYGTVYYKALKS